MAAAANMGRPCPPDPLWYRLDCILHLTCRDCGHTHQESAAAMGKSFVLGEPGYDV